MRLSRFPFGRVARSHARAARERRLECDLAVSSRSLVARPLPFRDRGDFASRNDSAVLLVNFVCGNLGHEYYFSINYYTLESPKILEGLLPFIGSEISLRDFLSISKKSVLGRRVGDGAMKKLNSS